MPEDSGLRVLGLKIALYGFALMFVGIGLTEQLQAEMMAALSPVGKEAAKVVPMIPSIVGAILTFRGAVRFGLSTPRFALLWTGIGLVVAATVFPLAAAPLFAAMKTYSWNFASLLPLFVLRITGLIFVSIAVLRWLAGVPRKATQSRSDEASDDAT